MCCAIPASCSACTCVGLSLWIQAPTFINIIVCPWKFNSLCLNIFIYMTFDPCLTHQAKEGERKRVIRGGNHLQTGEWLILIRSLWIIDYVKVCRHLIFNFCLLCICYSMAWCHLHNSVEVWVVFGENCDFLQNRVVCNVVKAGPDQMVINLDWSHLVSQSECGWPTPTSFFS